MRYDRDTILGDVSLILDDMTPSVDKEFSGGITPDTELVADLGFASMDLVMLLVAIEGRYEIQGLPFEELFLKDGQYVQHLTVRHIVDFLGRTLNEPDAHAKP
jgi:acyl carrier protein